MNSNGKNVIAIHFSAYVLTIFGENVFIVGNCPELGLWQPKNGIKLQTNPKQYPIWYSKKPIILQKLINLQYKLCILDQQNKIIRWENLKFNRTLSLKTSCSIFLTQGQPQVEYNFENQDTISTQVNSAKKNELSDIEQEQNQDQPVVEQKQKYHQIPQRKRHGSSSEKMSINTLLDEQFELTQQNKQQKFIIFNESDNKESKIDISI